MTGTLVSFGQGIGEMLLGRGRPAGFLPHALLWIAFTIGAGTGAWFYSEFDFMAIAGPAAAAGAMALIALLDSIIRTIRRLRQKKR